jgi:glutamate-1-semialdehyde-2,1-aminomutase
MPHPRPNTEKAFAKMARIVPGGVNSPIRAFKQMQMTPMIVQKGEGAILTDIDGYRYIDFCGSFGPLIHGHCHPYIQHKVEKRLSLGTTFGITTEIELQLAEKICSLVPSIEMIRFVNSGTEATMTALRIARGFTQRNIILKFTGHYHGHSDSLLVQAGSGLVGINATSSSLGIPEEFVKYTFNVPFNDFDAVKQAFDNNKDKIAAIILEPVAANMGVVPPVEGFLEFLREITLENGTLLIFDEVITGFRIGLQGAQGHYNIAPDLTCFGKIIGGGFPTAAVGGQKEIMSVLAPLGGVYQAGTLSGNPVAMQAGLAALELLEEPNFYEDLEEKTKALVEPLREFPVAIQRVGSLFSIHFGKSEIRNFEDILACDVSQFRTLFHHLFEMGIYPPPHFAESWFVSAAHTDEQIDYTRDTITAYLSTLFSNA